MHIRYTACSKYAAGTIMIIDVTGIVLTPGDCGNRCLGNGKHTDSTGNPIECCCDECDYVLCCMENRDPKNCENCTDKECPGSPVCIL